MATSSQEEISTIEMKKVDSGDQENVTIHIDRDTTESPEISDVYGDEIEGSSFEIEGADYDLPSSTPTHKISKNKRPSSHDAKRKRSPKVKSKRRGKEVIFHRSETNRNTSSPQPWNSNILMLLKKLGTKMTAYRWMHHRESTNMINKENILSKTELVLMIVFGTILGSEFISVLAESGLNENQIVMISMLVIRIVIMTIYAIVKGMRESGDLLHRSYKHKYASTRFGELSLEIQNQFSLNVEDRENDKAFLKNIIKTFDELMLVVPNISEKVSRSYLEAIEDNDIYTPILMKVGGGTSPDAPPNTYNREGDIKDSTDTNSPENDNSKTLEYQIQRWSYHY